MILVAPGLYFMVDVGHTELPKSFQTYDSSSMEKYKYEVKNPRDDIKMIVK